MSPVGVAKPQWADQYIRAEIKWPPFPDDIFKCIFLNENVWTRLSIPWSIFNGPINNIPASVQIMGRRRPGAKALSELVMVRLLTHICITRSQWVNALSHHRQPQRCVRFFFLKIFCEFSLNVGDFVDKITSHKVADEIDWDKQSWHYEIYFFSQQRVNSIEYETVYIITSFRKYRAATS